MHRSPLVGILGVLVCLGCSDSHGVSGTDQGVSDQGMSEDLPWSDSPHYVAPVDSPSLDVALRQASASVQAMLARVCTCVDDTLCESGTVPTDEEIAQLRECTVGIVGSADVVHRATDIYASWAATTEACLEQQCSAEAPCDAVRTSIDLASDEVLQVLEAWGSCNAP